MKIIYCALLSLLMCILPFSVDAQDQEMLLKVTASVVDATGAKVENANIIASKSRKTVITDNEGNFEIEVTAQDVLIVSCLGYEKLVLPVNSGNIDNNQVILTQWGKINADQRINIAHGYLPFERITGSVDRITGKELEDYPTLDVKEALAGRLSGLWSFYGSASPESEGFGNTIRGTGFGQIYVDGVPGDVTETADEIEDIIIAKDFGSAFLYGGAAADGAMIVNTKKGVKGENLIKFSYRSGLRRPTFLPDLMDAQTYASNFNRALENDGLTPIYSAETIGHYVNGTDSIRNPNNDYYKDLVDDPAIYQHFTADFAGGKKIVRYYSHLGYYNSEGIESVGSGRNIDRLRLKSNVEVSLGDYGKFFMGVGGSFLKRKGPNMSGDNLFQTMYNYPANAFPYMINDSIFGRQPEYGTNMLVELAHGSVKEDLRRDGYTRVGLDLDLNDLTEGLSFNTTVSMYIYNNVSQKLDPSPDIAEPVFSKTFDGRDTIILRNYSKSVKDNKWGRVGDRVDRNQYISSALNYDRTFNENHALIANLIYTQRRANGNLLNQENRLRNIGIRTNYMLKGKYVLEANLMNSAVRQLKEEERKKLFYTGGVAWLLHKESFLSNVQWLGFLKLRANYGVLGMPFGEYNLYDNLYAGSGAGGFGVLGATSSSGGMRRYLTGTDEILYPKKEYLNIGADFQVFNSKINGQVNYFNIRNYDILSPLTNVYALVPTNYMPVQNYTDIELKGMDGRISYSNKIGKVGFAIDVNAMYLTSYTNQSNSLIYPDAEGDRNSVGNNGNRIIGLEADGIFQTWDEVNNATPQMFGEVKPGDIKYKDYNKDGVIDERDYHEIATTSKIFYGLNLRAKYKNLSVSIHADGRLGGEFNDGLHRDRGTNNYTTEMAKAWPASNELPRLSTFTNVNNNRASTFWLKKASYLNLRSVNVSYAVPHGLVRNSFIKDASIYVAGKNLAVLSSLSDRYMPSQSKGYTQHPVLNALELGLDITF